MLLYSLQHCATRLMSVGAVVEAAVLGELEDVLFLISLDTFLINKLSYSLEGFTLVFALFKHSFCGKH